MRGRHAVLLAFVVYVSLDLSLAAMPGAFVFDVDDSVESVQVTRARLTADATVLPWPATPSIALPEPRADAGASRPAVRAPVRLRHPAVRLPRAAGDSTPPSEDPH